MVGSVILYNYPPSVARGARPPRRVAGSQELHHVARGTTPPRRASGLEARGISPPRHSRRSADW